MEIKINKCASVCCICGKIFVHEEKVYSKALIDTTVLERRDYCSLCDCSPTGVHVFCTWETVYADPKVKEEERQATYSPLRSLFYELADSTDRSDLAQAFLLAQLLKRQKVFRLIRESEENTETGRITLYLDRIENRLIETRDLDFKFAELESARVRLIEHLQRIENPEEATSNIENSEDTTCSVSPDATEEVGN